MKGIIRNKYCHEIIGLQNAFPNLEINSNIYISSGSELLIGGFNLLRMFLRMRAARCNRDSREDDYKN